MFQNIDPLMGQSGGRASYSTLALMLSGNGNHCSWEYKQRCCSIGSKLIPVGRGDPLAGQFREKWPAHGSITKILARGWVVRPSAQPSSPDPRPELPQSHSRAHL